MKKNTNYDPKTDYNFDDDSFNSEILLPFDEEEMEGVEDYLEDLEILRNPNQ